MHDKSWAENSLGMWTMVCFLAICVLCLTPLVAAASESGADPQCAVTVDPVPSGMIDRPYVEVPKQHTDPFLHSSTHLQGLPAAEKWAGGLIHHPAVSTWFNEMTSAIVVDNPHPTLQTTVDIEFFDHRGINVGSSNNITIAPEGFHVEAATPLASAGGFGSARVRVHENEPKIVGAVLWHLTRLFDGNGFEVLDPDYWYGVTPGAASMQQLQVVQGATKLSWGLLPVSSVGAIDFFNGAQPILNVVNPNNQPNTIRVELSIHTLGSGTTLQTVWRVATLPPNGSLTDILGPHLADLSTNATKGLWNQLYARYAALAAANLGSNTDYTLRVTSESGLPILGDVVVTDIWGPDPQAVPLGGLVGVEPEPRDNLVLGERFRMASSMLAPTANWKLLNPDLTFDFTPGNGVADMRQTVMLVSNVGSTDAGPVLIEYHDRDGNLLSSASVASLLPDQTLRIRPGAYNYPTTTHNPFGWARITACQPSAELQLGVRRFQRWSLFWFLRRLHGSLRNDFVNARGSPSQQLWGGPARILERSGRS